MAANENQGLHIALIILFMLFVALSLSTFVFFGQANSNYSKAVAAAEDARKATEKLGKLVDEINELKQVIGFSDPETDLAKVKSSFADDIKAYAATLPTEKQHYRQALEELAKSIVDVQTKNTALAEELSVVKAKNATTEEAANAKIATAEAATGKANKELADEKAKFMEAQKKSETDKKELSDQIAKMQGENAAELEKVTKSVDEGKKELAKANSTINELKRRINELQGGTFAVDDGEVRSVTSRDQTVTINLGSNDGLRPLTTFIVHSPTSSPGDRTGQKGRIEVTRLLNEHLAEARIVEGTLDNMILPGDKIYSALWDPGRRERFAIVGRIDVDGDGRDNRDRLKSMITLSGGIIDAEIDAEGKSTGKISVETRYIIEGDIPPRTKPAVDKLLAEGQLLGVERIGVDKFLDYIGFKANTQVVRYGANSNADTARQRLPDGGLGKTSDYYTDLFRKRTPPAHLKSDAATSGGGTGGGTSAPRGGATNYYRF